LEGKFDEMDFQKGLLRIVNNRLNRNALEAALKQEREPTKKVAGEDMFRKLVKRGRKPTKKGWGKKEKIFGR